MLNTLVSRYKSRLLQTIFKGSGQQTDFSVFMKKVCFLLINISFFISCKPGKLPVVSDTISEPKQEFIAEAPVVTLGEKSLGPSNIVAVLEDYVVSDSVDFQIILNEVITRKRYYFDAIEKGYDINPSQKEEFETYKRIISKSFVLDSSLINNLAEVTYSRLKKEIRASHILIALPLYSSPKDTLAAYQLLTNLKTQISNGASFDSLALAHSADINTKENGGDMGWFSALQLLYPLENVAFQLNKGQVSDPVRTEAGYHLLKVTDIRPFSGKVEVRHILKAIPEEANNEFSLYQKSKIDSLYALLQSGKDFIEICQNNSDDLKTKDAGGLLAPFSIGSWAEKSFEQAAFSLKPGQISEPIKSSIGWHIIKSERKFPLEPYETLEDQIVNKITTDSRGLYLNELARNKYRSRLNIEENKNNLEDLFSLADERLLKRNWKADRSILKSNVLFKAGQKTFTVSEFLNYAEDRQTFEKHTAGYSPEMYLRWFYNDWKKQNLDALIIENLANWDNSFSSTIQSFKEGLVVSNYLNDNLYEKSVADTTGQRLFYERNIGKYQWPRKARAMIIRTSADSLIQEYYSIIEDGKPFRLKRGIAPFYFEKNKFDLSNELKQKLTGLLLIMEKNPGYVVEIGGHRDIGEEVITCSKRIQAVVEYLTKEGLDITRIREYDYDVNKLVDRFDWPQNQRITFQFFSKDKRDVEKILNSKDNTFQVAYGNYYEGENELIDGTSWQVGSYETTFEGYKYRIDIEEIFEPKAKTLKEARGSVIKDYQKTLEQQLNAELTVKYPATIEIEKVKALFEDHKKKNLLN